ncbi:WD40/YVTN/BNR-like repeat-containing protein [Micromonospora sp. CB01531]|uniref:WD40/YVTN/BNR-like repeat-containing protein n=1 Tax=Micromonospora sp. CB01531 TaxID=1718947 RepID=UPI000938B564|nr:hypothetical protein [Micromonospora sp. CB01531]OKI57970.1 hypothetical protein A6A27_06935 [Micromonospora sp. CB01531]
MSERDFAGFDVGTIAEAVRQPPLDDLRPAARSRRRHRSAGLAVTVLVALVGVAVGPLAARSVGTDWAGPDQPAHPDRASDFVLTSGDSGVGVANLNCTLYFTRTRDYGRTWSAWGAARYRATTCQVDAYGNEYADLEYAVLSERVYFVREGDRSSLSTDRGRTWQDADKVIKPVAAFPRFAAPVFCRQGCGALRELLAVDAAGTVYRLTGAKPSPYPPFSIYPSMDGTIWVTYWPGEANRAVVARSADRGATWTTWRAEAEANVIAVVGVDDRRGYLLIEPSPPAGSTVPVGQSRLLRTTDGGRTWTDTGTDLPAAQYHRNITVGWRGSLLVAVPGNSSPNVGSKLLMSRDDGRHFAVVRDYGRLDGAVGVAPGYAWLYGWDDMSDVGPDHVWVTGDGSSWARFALPR